MPKTIYYIFNKQQQQFYVYDDHNKAKATAESFGTRELRMGDDIYFIPKYEVQRHTFKRYYGTVFLTYKKDNGSISAWSLFSHWKDAKHNLKFGYQLKKFVLSPYEETSTKAEQYYTKTLPKGIKRGSPGF